MSSFEEQIATRSTAVGRNEPAATDLDYYSKPENYTGSNLQALQRFTRDKYKQEKCNKEEVKKKVVKDAKYHFFHRYKHILSDAIFHDDLQEREREAESDESDYDEEGGSEGAATSRGGSESRASSRSLVRGGSRSKGASSGKESRAKSGEPLVVIQESLEDDRSSPSSGRYKKSNVDLRENASSYSPSWLSDDRTLTPDSMRSKTPHLSVGSRRNYVPTPSRSRLDSFHVLPQVEQVSSGPQTSKTKDLFVRAAKCVKAICTLCASARGNKQSAATMKTFMDIVDDSAKTEENMKKAGLFFDPNQFKAKKEIMLTTETKHILTIPSAWRTPEMIQTAMYGLQTLRSYAEYPLHMQEKLAKVAWYEVVGPKRIIIRQGHYAENFYFVLSGNAVVTILLKDPKTGASFVKTATVMRRGMSFGELALLHHSKRTATVTSQDRVELLSIGRVDFFDIFMASQGPDEMPDHIKFISNLEFMKGWPIEELVENPQHCLLHFFKRNNTIVANSNATEWIYIVKSGSCQILKKLKGVIPNSQFFCRAGINRLDTPSARFRAIIYAPKVDTGKRKNSSAGDEKNERPPTEGEKNPDDKDRHGQFSKDQYSQNPATKPAHFSANQQRRRESCFEKRKLYDPPRKCKPPRPGSGKTKSPGQNKPGPVFVQVSSLNPRDVFGLDTIQFSGDVQRTHTSVSLVSGAAECIMLSKEFFVQHANEATKKFIREFVRPYPDEEVFQENLQIKEDWTLYKRTLLTDLTSHLVKQHNRYNS